MLAKEFEASDSAVRVALNVERMVAAAVVPPNEVSRLMAVVLNSAGQRSGGQAAPRIIKKRSGQRGNVGRIQRRGGQAIGADKRVGDGSSISEVFGQDEVCERHVAGDRIGRVAAGQS